MSTYKINGVSLLVDPTTARWVDRQVLARDGNGHPVYAAVRQFEMKWQLLSPSGTYQLQQFFDAVITTGTAVAELPKYAAYDYAFYAYSGCVLDEPVFDPYYAENLTNVTWLISKIKT